MNVSRTLFCFLVIGLLGTAGPAWGQSFRRSYNPQTSFCRDVVETADGGFLMAGGISNGNTMFLQRTNPLGGAVWTNHAALNGAYGVAVCAAPDGGFAVLCENYLDAGTLHSAVLKIDGGGVIQWLKVLENPGLPNGFTDIVCTGDAGFALTGTGRQLSPVVDFYIRLLKLDAGGTLQWEQTLGTSTTKDLANRLLELPNGDLVVAGEQRDDAAPVVDQADFFLARCNAQGNILWQNGYPEADYQRLYDLQASPDGGFVLLGETYLADPVRIALLKTDGAGAKLWYKNTISTVSSTSSQVADRVVTCFTQDLAGNLYVPVHGINPDFSSKLALVKFDAAGDSVWTHTSNAEDFPYAVLYTSDNHFAIAGKSGLDGANAILIKSDWTTDNQSFFSTISGVVFLDQNDNCNADSTESGPPQFILEAHNQFDEHLFRAVSPDGSYTFAVSPGNYTLTLHSLPGTETLWQACDTPTVNIAGINQTVQAPAIGVKSLAECPYLSVELAASPIRRCTTMTYTANYCNFGNVTATDVSIQLDVDPLMSYVSSTQPLSAQNGDTYTFEVPDVAPGQCADVRAIFTLSCTAVNGQAICAEAHIFPDSSCLPPSQLWDGSNLEVNASCNGNAEFTITNTGDDMTGIAEYVIIEDQIMYMQGSIQLDAGADSVIVIANPTGNSYYLQAEQRPGHPANSLPAAVADMCNGQTGQSLALQLPLTQAGSYLTTYCDAVVGSFDPNDKRGFPLGWHNEHYLPVGQDIEYMIRFQNTGNDTAFLVIIRDQLPSELDPTTVRPGPASHPYTFELGGNGLLKFTFAKILLPDSTTNEAASHGYVTFRVAQQPDLPNGTRIENEAAIYFDFNDPVITDKYFHTIGEPLLSFIVDRPVSEALNLVIQPNPAQDEANFRLVEATPGQSFRLGLYDARGQLVRSETFSGAEHRFQRRDLPAGLYFFRLEDASGKRTGGKIILR